jgi:hypothetical protein
MKIHPSQIVSAYYKALDFAKGVINNIAKEIDTNRD